MATLEPSVYHIEVGKQTYQKEREDERDWENERFTFNSPLITSEDRTVHFPKSQSRFLDIVQDTLRQYDSQLKDIHQKVRTEAGTLEILSILNLDGDSYSFCFIFLLVQLEFVKLTAE
ncbi:hypothetical protein N7457_000791 [Penicillium paradoxum]|uniref:uncharacterized protein n=1 Tax=Penicillium paradoxum TaxID=176176 RepID=UPI00254949FA|nr:uncharacterized protein N7457_000791 [Penicillium paradoxum]KAJ5794192.1 hypothetical protein N7457_000791 [Penicillium paradoxum]